MATPEDIDRGIAFAEYSYILMRPAIKIFEAQPLDRQQGRCSASHFWHLLNISIFCGVSAYYTVTISLWP
ncbi:MAG: hypothetical protein AABZ67_12485 [Pseudomonadota bacterium]